MEIWNDYVDKIENTIAINNKHFLRVFQIIEAMFPKKMHVGHCIQCIGYVHIRYMKEKRFDGPLSNTRFKVMPELFSSFDPGKFKAMMNYKETLAIGTYSVTGQFQLTLKK